MSLYTWHTKDLSTLVVSFVVTLTTAQGTYAAGEVVVDSTHPSAAPSVSIVNNVPVVEIVAPNVDGLSHNKFLEFNVPTQGLIFNNSTLAGISDLAGQLNANTALNGHAATFILNEVTGLNTSLLQGYSEVFGQSASLVIANPNGIYANGAGFINTPNVLLTTGVPTFQNGQLSFNVERGLIIVENKAVDLRFTESTDLVAKQLILNAPLVAGGRIGLYAGQGIFKDGNFSNSQHTQSTQLAIDASALGAMSAGRIFIIANEQGAGVKLDGQLSATADNIDISANGDITLKNLHAKRDIDLSSATHNAYLTGQTLAGENARIHAEGIAISGNVATNKRLDLHSNQDLVVTGQAIAGTTLNIDSAHHLHNQGLLYSTGDAHIEMGSIDNQQGLILSEAVLDIATLKGDLINNGTIFAGTELNINSANHVINQQQGELGSSGKTLVSAIGNVVNQDSTMMSNQNMSLRAGDNIIQNGIIDTKGSTTLRADDILLANNQQLNASGTIDLIAQQKMILASGTIKALAQVNITAQADISNNAAIDAVGKVSIFTPSAFSNTSTIDTSSTLNLTIGKKITNQGRLYSQQSLDLILNDDLYNDGGVIASDENINISYVKVSDKIIDLYNEKVFFNSEWSVDKNICEW
ncbi:MAG: filamentous hemagglutinin N-terminal domain-containing protein [Agitococcus sp.]|nr:filamentous hemagglutinin N-terminal domain-containing protein [Agitococcus sp.]